jgi:5-formyltetrahydrofolate cyclo-ligase
VPGFAQAQGVGGYYAVGAQVPTLVLLTRLTEQEGRRAYLPFVQSGELQLAEWQPSWPLTEGEYVHIQPRFARRVPLSDVDVVLVPGVAFDREGRRLGDGRGLWDGLLSRLPAHTLRIGVAYSAQLVDRVPDGGSDQRVDHVVTEDGVVATGARDLSA